MSEALRGKKRPRRPNFPHEFKIALVEQPLQPVACVVQIARENGINVDLLHALNDVEPCYIQAVA